MYFTNEYVTTDYWQLLQANFNQVGNKKQQTIMRFLSTHIIRVRMIITGFLKRKKIKMGISKIEFAFFLCKNEGYNINELKIIKPRNTVIIYVYLFRLWFQFFSRGLIILKQDITVGFSNVIPHKIILLHFVHNVNNDINNLLHCIVSILW